MRKKLAVILAATLTLQSFTVPAFAGEQYDEVVEVIEDAEGLEAAEDISDDEDIDINYGDDTAETFDETAVDVAEDGEEIVWEDNGGDYVEEPEELAIAPSSSTEYYSTTDSAYAVTAWHISYDTATNAFKATASWTKDTVVQPDGDATVVRVTTPAFTCPEDNTAEYYKTAAIVLKFEVDGQTITDTVANLHSALNETASVTSKPINIQSKAATCTTKAKYKPVTIIYPADFDINTALKNKAIYDVGGTTVYSAEDVTKALTVNGTCYLVAYSVPVVAGTEYGTPADHTPKNPVTTVYETTDPKGTTVSSTPVNVKLLNSPVADAKTVTAFTYNTNNKTLIDPTKVGFYYEVTTEECAFCDAKGTKMTQYVVMPTATAGTEFIDADYTDGVVAAGNIDGYYWKNENIKPYGMEFKTLGANVTLTDGTVITANTADNFNLKVFNDPKFLGFALKNDSQDAIYAVCRTLGDGGLATLEANATFGAALTATLDGKDTSSAVVDPSLLAVKYFRNGEQISKATALTNTEVVTKSIISKGHKEFKVYHALNEADEHLIGYNADGTPYNKSCAKAIDVNEITICLDARYNVGTPAHALPGNTVADCNKDGAYNYTAGKLVMTANRNLGVKKITLPKSTDHTYDTDFVKAMEDSSTVVEVIQKADLSLDHYLIGSVNQTLAGNGPFFTMKKNNLDKDKDGKPDGYYDVEKFVRTSTTTYASATTFVVKINTNNMHCQGGKESTMNIALVCDVCEDESKNYDVKVGAHKTKKPDTYTMEQIKAATCKEVGQQDKVKYCEICNDELERVNEEIPQKAHNIAKATWEVDLVDNLTSDLTVISNGPVKVGDKILVGDYDIHQSEQRMGAVGFGLPSYQLLGHAYKTCSDCGEKVYYDGFALPLIKNSTGDLTGFYHALEYLELFSKEYHPTATVADEKLYIEVLEVTPQDNLGNPGSITVQAVYSYKDATRTLHEFKSEPETRKYYTSANAFLDRETNNDAKKATELINALPAAADLTSNDLTKVAEAKAAYDALTANKKALVDAATNNRLPEINKKAEEIKAQEASKVKSELDAAVKAVEAASAGSDAQKTAIENLEKAIATAKVADVDTTAAEKTLKDQKDVYDKAAAAIAAAEKAAAAAQANPTAENIKAAEDAIAAAKAAGVADADLKKATDAEKAAEKAKKDADDKKIADAVKAAEAAANAAKANPTAATVKAAEDAIAAAKKAGATDAQLANAKAATEAAKKAAEPKDATIKVSKTTVKKGKKTTIKITSDAGTKITVTAANKKAKNKKSVKIKSGTTAKLTFKKAAKKGTYKFKVSTAAVGNFKATSKTIKIKVK